MPLEDLLIKVKQDKAQEEQQIRADHQRYLEELKQNKMQQISSLQKELDNALAKKKKNFLAEKERKKSFSLNMERLELKKELLQKAKDKALEKLLALPLEKKKPLYLKKIKEEMPILQEAKEIIVLPSRSQEILQLLQTIGLDKKIREENIGLKDGFLARGENWFLSVSLQEILEEYIERDKKKFINILFNDL